METEFLSEMSREAFLAAAVLLCTLPSADGFLSGPSLGSRQRRPVSTVACRLAASSGLNEGDAVTVIGANSPVGRLLAERLLADGRFRVRLISNNPSVREHSLWSFSVIYMLHLTISDHQ